MLVPMMVFEEMFTSSNYNDNVKRTTVGRNGVGAKACNVFSKKFTVETGKYNLSSSICLGVIQQLRGPKSNQF